MRLTFLGATKEVTGSCFLLTVGHRQVLIECGLVQGSRHHERHNRAPFPFEPRDIDAVVLTHAHLDHSGRLPLMVKRGFSGPIYTHPATADLCTILLEDAGYLNEREAQWENEKRERDGEEPIEPLYTRQEARKTRVQFKTVNYGRNTEILPGIRFTFRDAGHILGSAIVEFNLNKDGRARKLVFSGDLGHSGAPILRDPEDVSSADLVVLESTYGDRLHRPWHETWSEIGEIISSASSAKGNILIPAFSVGRTQEILYVFQRHFNDWGLADWKIYLDSPMGIEATKVYSHHAKLYDAHAREIFESGGDPFALPNLHLCVESEASMKLNEVRSGAIIIAGSGMCTGGRIKHHFKHNIWREHAHVIIVGFQPHGTLGRALVDGAQSIRLWGDTVAVRARIHTIGGLSAHADQQGLVNWYRGFVGQPRVALVHGEPDAMHALAARLVDECQADVVQAEFEQVLDL